MKSPKVLNSGAITKKRARILFIISFLILSLVFAMTLTYGIKHGFTQKQMESFKGFLIELGKSQPKAEIEKSTNEKVVIEKNIDIETNTTIKVNNTPIAVKPSPISTRQSSQTQTQTPKKECYRYTVTHLDGSTSNLCYSKSDYDQLVDLGFKLSSAKGFYQFHLDGVNRYQAEYEKTGSSIYLEAKASQQSQADAEQAKIGPLTLQMQEIEKRGY